MADEYGKDWRYQLERQHSVNNPIIVSVTYRYYSRFL